MIGTLLIQIIHILVILFIFLTPLFESEYMLTLHMVLIPFIMLHWLTNQTVCALTEIEKMVRGEASDEGTFFGKLMTPIYKSESFIGRLAAPFHTFKDEDEEKRRRGRARCGAAGQGRCSVLDPVVVGGGGV